VGGKPSRNIVSYFCGPRGLKWICNAKDAIAANFGGRYCRRSLWKEKGVPCDLGEYGSQRGCCELHERNLASDWAHNSEDAGWYDQLQKKWPLGDSGAIGLIGSINA
jgi:hypothetical protein